MIKVLSRRPLVLFKRGPRNNSSNKNKFSNVSLIVNIYHIALMVKEMKMNTKEEKTMTEVLPKDCIANILSHIELSKKPHIERPYFWAPC
jgi:hypothetical protein